MEFRPSYARAVDRASGATKNPLPASLAGCDAPEARRRGAAASPSRSRLAPSPAPRLIDLERRAKFARADFAPV
jgi:hypothetical protein